jgi:hypothetical protein
MENSTKGRFGSRDERLARIAQAEADGYRRWAPYECIGVMAPRWCKDGSHYSFEQLPPLREPVVAGVSPPAPAVVPRVLDSADPADNPTLNNFIF